MEMSETETKEEKQAIDDKYTFYAMVCELPNNKKIADIVIILIRDYGFTIKNENFDIDSCHYKITKDEKTWEVFSYEELLEFYKNVHYRIDEYRGTNFYEKVQSFVEGYVQSTHERIKEITKDIYPEIELFKNLFIDC